MSYIYDPAVQFTSYQNLILRTADQTIQHFLNTKTYTLVQTHMWTLPYILGFKGPICGETNLLLNIE